MSTPTPVQEEFPEVLRMLLEQWLHHNEIPMSAAEYVAAGRSGRLSAEISAPFREVFDR